MQGITLTNGVLSIAGLSEEQMLKFYLMFRKDLLDSNISHYRPIAFKVYGGSGSQSKPVSSNIEQLKNFGLSFSELSFVLDNIIVNEKDGEMPPELNAVASLTHLRSDCTFMTIMGTSIGSNFPGTMYYHGKGVSTPPNTLLSNMVIFNNLVTSETITIILMRGKGFRDFQDNSVLTYKTNFKPMRTSYNLYDIVAVKEYTGGPSIKLNYKQDVNEEVMLSIIKDYMDSKEVRECLKLDL